MASKKQPSFLAALETLLETRTQREAALLLGVSERTIRRWKNEGSIPKPHREQKITTVYREEIKTKSAARKKHIPIKLTRMIGGSYYYGVKGQSNWNMAMLLKHIASIAPKGYPPLIRFIIKIPKGGTSPGGREYKQGGFYSTMAMSLEHAETDSDFLDYVEDFNKQNNVHEIVRMLPWEQKKQARPSAKSKGKRK